MWDRGDSGKESRGLAGHNDSCVLRGRGESGKESLGLAGIHGSVAFVAGLAGRRGVPKGSEWMGPMGVCDAIGLGREGLDGHEVERYIFAEGNGMSSIESPASIPERRRILAVGSPFDSPACRVLISTAYFE